MDKIRRFLKSRLGFALILSLVFCLVQIPLVLHHELVLEESQFYYRYFAPLGISYTVARFVPLSFTTLMIFLISLVLPFRRLAKICLAFSSLFFYFNSVLLVGFRLVPFGREISFASPIDFLSSLNEAWFHTFLPVLQLCLIPIIIYLLDCIFHFKLLRKSEIVKWGNKHSISGAVVFLIPVILSIPNAFISAAEDFSHRYSDRAAISSVIQELNQLPSGAMITYSDQTMREFMAVYAPLLTDGRTFYDLTIGTTFDGITGGEEQLTSSDIEPALPQADHLYFLVQTGICTPTREIEPQSNWEYLGLIRQLDDMRAYDFYRVK